MSKRLNKDIWETNSLMMGSGVGVATLEAMFNMVNTQSLLSASMVRDFEMSHPLQMQALALAMAQIIAAGEACSNPPPVAVKMPERPAAKNADDDETELGAVPNVAALNNMLKAQSPDQGGETSNVSLGSTTVNSGDMDKHMSEMLEMLREHLSEITKNTKQTLAVT